MTVLLYEVLWDSGSFQLIPPIFLGSKIEFLGIKMADDLSSRTDEIMKKTEVKAGHGRGGVNHLLG